MKPKFPQTVLVEMRDEGHEDGDSDFRPKIRYNMPEYCGLNNKYTIATYVLVKVEEVTFDVKTVKKEIKQ